MITKEPTRAKKIFARTCIAICVGIVAFPAIAKWVKNRPVDYDYDASIAKLKKIGAALQLYRAEYGVKPVAERRTYSDAGLPPSMLVLARPGHLWSLPDGETDLQLADARYGQNYVAMSFAHLYWRPEEYDVFFDLSNNFSGRGEHLPILADFNPQVALGLRAYEQPVVDSIILRLAGEVEVVEYNRLVQHDIYTK